jgi:hypothetical protein
MAAGERKNLEQLFNHWGIPKSVAVTEFKLRTGYRVSVVGFRFLPTTETDYR